MRMLFSFVMPAVILALFSCSDTHTDRQFLTGKWSVEVMTDSVGKGEKNPAILAGIMEVYPDSTLHFELNDRAPVIVRYRWKDNATLITTDTNGQEAVCKVHNLTQDTFEFSNDRLLTRCVRR